MHHPTACIVAAIVVGLLLLVVLALAGMAGRNQVWETEPGLEEQPEPTPPAPSFPRLGYVPTQRAEGHEWLPMSPDARAAEVDMLRALLHDSPSEADVQTDLPADPGPHKPA